MVKPLTKFYLSCLLSSWGDRIWFFALSIYFVTINKDTLLMTALNGLICNIFSILFGPILGGLVDKHQRIRVVRYSLFIQNFTVALNCVVVVLIIFYKDFTQETWNGWFLYAAQGAMIMLNVISKLASTTTKISIERDWVVVISEYLSRDSNEQEQKSKNLTLINSTVRRIDLSTNVIAPLVAGLIMSFLNIEYSFNKNINGTVISAVIFAIWNIFSYLIEYTLLSSVYKNIPSLKKSKLERSIEKNKASLMKKIRNSFKFTKKGWKVYFQQGPILMPSLALSLLFLTVLSFDGITIGYAKYQNLKEFTISIFQGVGSVTGILGTIAFPILHNKIKMRLQLVGIIGGITQLTFLFGCLTAIFLPGSPFSISQIFFPNSTSNCTTLDSSSNETIPFWSWNTFVESDCRVYTSIIVLLSCMALSRFGLWLSDLVIHQIFQENIKESERGVVGGVQWSINTVFDLLKYISVIFFSDIHEYGYLVIMSVMAVSVSFVLYTIYAVSTGCKNDDEIEMKEMKIRKSMIKHPAEFELEETDSFDEGEDNTNENDKLNKQ
ncbi:unnamed protein product [Brachionus calyciflorus]|uniref:Solute carrier family 40 member n=1 Tax=Brachionus calyciflorus TaxID=104777 RepID=A0A814F3M1_9BILA|nr:unnamed protein product [Brachionus calyciflorus]